MTRVRPGAETRKSLVRICTSVVVRPAGAGDCPVLYLQLPLISSTHSGRCIEPSLHTAWLRTYAVIMQLEARAGNARFHPNIVPGTSCCPPCEGQPYKSATRSSPLRRNLCMQSPQHDRICSAIHLLGHTSTEITYFPKNNSNTADDVAPPRPAMPWKA
jgi:hypothetical protein